jgi:hypothetical protein
MTNFAEECKVREEKNMKTITENMKSEMFMFKTQEVYTNTWCRIQ